MQEYFNQLADELTGLCTGEEVLLLNVSGEQSDFARFNRSAVRQAGAVTQTYFSLELIVGARHASETITLCGEASQDRRRAEGALQSLREQLPHCPDDPYLLYNTNPADSEQIGENRLGAPEAAMDAILAAGQGRDLVGIFAQGAIFRGFANSLGQRNWFGTHSFNLDWCFYDHGDKAVKTSYAGFEWREDEFARKIAQGVEQLDILTRPPKTIDPGEVRVYLAPAALHEILNMLCWGGFSLKQHRSKDTCLLQMIEAGATLAPSVTLRENTADGLAPNFTTAGYGKPNAITLIEGGHYKDCLVSPRSGREFDQTPNSGAEFPNSLDMAAGEIETDDILRTLDTGVYANQLWYLNFSDRPAGRMTGMTRFATFWVEGGEIVAPLNVMRFDETVYRALGENLVALTRQRDLIPDPSTYQARSTESVRLPGAVIENFRFTL